MFPIVPVYVMVAKYGRRSGFVATATSEVATAVVDIELHD